MQGSGTKNDYKGKVSLHKPKAPRKTSQLGCNPHPLCRLLTNHHNYDQQLTAGVTYAVTEPSVPELSCRNNQLLF